MARTKKAEGGSGWHWLTHGTEGYTGMDGVVQFIYGKGALSGELLAVQQPTWFNAEGEQIAGPPLEDYLAFYADKGCKVEDMPGGRAEFDTWQVEALKSPAAKLRLEGFGEAAAKLESAEPAKVTAKAAPATKAAKLPHEGD